MGGQEGHEPQAQPKGRGHQNEGRVASHPLVHHLSPHMTLCTLPAVVADLAVARGREVIAAHGVGAVADGSLMLGDVTCFLPKKIVSFWLLDTHWQQKKEGDSSFPPHTYPSSNKSPATQSMPLTYYASSICQGFIYPPKRVCG